MFKTRVYYTEAKYDGRRFRAYFRRNRKNPGNLIIAKLNCEQQVESMGWSDRKAAQELYN